MAGEREELLTTPPSGGSTTPEGVACGWTCHGNFSATLQPHGKGVLQELRRTSDDEVRLERRITVEPSATYIFRAEVCSDDRLWIGIGERRMGYQGSGSWQTIADVVRSDKSGTLLISFVLGGWRKGPGHAQIRSVSLCRADRPELPRRRPHEPTVLCDGNEFTAVIVAPAEGGVYEALATKVQKAIREKTGCTIPCLTDHDVTEPHSPAIRSEFRSRPLILLGSLGTNRAIWSAYNRFLCAVDGHYPGNEGCVVSTAADVFHNGSDHIILGGSTRAGTERATDRFCELLEKDARRDGDVWTLPLLLDVTLDGECLRLFQEDDRLWREEPSASRFPGTESGYGAVVRWYYNAMAAYWTGWESYAERANVWLERILEEAAYTHHYILEWMVRVYCMWDRSPRISEEARARMDGFILHEFWDLLTGHDLCRMEIFAPPFEEILLDNRHNIAPWMADLTMAEFIQNRFELTGDLADIVEYRRREKAAMMNHCVSERWDSSLPSVAGCDNEEEIVASIFRYALEHDRYDYFESGNAAKALMLDRIHHVAGRFARPAGHYDYKLFLGMLASYTQDGQYRSLLQALPQGVEPARIFQNRYISGVHRYTPGEEVAPVPPDALAGVHAPPLQDHSQRRLLKDVIPGYAPMDFDPAEAVDVLSFRSGFGPKDDYVALSGTAGPTPVGCFLSFNTNGQEWFGTGPSAIISPPSQRAFDQNGVHVLRTDRWSGEERPFAVAARKEWLVDCSDSGGASMNIAPFMGTRWQRKVFWIRPGLYLIRDTITACEEGDYDVSVNWFPMGTGLWKDGEWIAEQGGEVLHIIPLSTDMTACVDTEGKGRRPSLRLKFSGALGQGDSVAAWSVFSMDERAALDQETLCAELRPFLQEETPSLDALAATPPIPTVLTTSGVEGLCDADWRYSGLLRPGRVSSATLIAPDTLDLGKVTDVAELRGYVVRGKWEPKAIPSDTQAAISSAAEAAPVDERDWVPVQGPTQWRPGLQTGNYGRAIPTEACNQVMHPSTLRTRFLRSKDVETVCCYDRGQAEARTPLRLEMADLTGNGTPDLLVVPDAWPLFLRKRALEDSVIAGLTVNGEELLQFEPPCGIQAVRLLDIEGTGHPRPVVVTDDAKIRILENNGAVQQEIDLFAMHQDFNATHGRPNTRHPIGGFTMPYSLGLWRPNKDGRRGLVVGRYCAFSFLDAEGNFEGVLHNVGYVLADLLACGQDFDGDGVEEQLCLGREGIHHLHGSATPHIADPEGPFFYPQVYAEAYTHAPAIAPDIDGAPVHLFRSVALGGEGARYVMVVRGNYVGIYDGKKRRWTYTWTPLVEITAADIVEDAAERLGILFATGDGRLWSLSWTDDAGHLAHYDTVVLQDCIRRIRGGADTPGGAFLCGDHGLYRVSADGKARRIAEGAFQDALALDEASGIAVTQRGEVVRIRIPTA
jgi:hypothetical protein